MLRCWLRPTKPQTASTPSSAAASNTPQQEVVLLPPRRRRRGAAGCRSRRGPRCRCRWRRLPPARAPRAPDRRAGAGPACWPRDRASPPAARRPPTGAAPPRAGCSRRPARARTASQSSMARSGSASRTSRGVSSCSAAVSTPTFMNFGANGATVIGTSVQTPPLSGALEDCLHDPVGAVAVFECGDGRRQRAIRRAGGNDAVDVAHQIAEGVRPRLLVAARQVRVPRAAVVEQRRVLLQHLVGARRGGRTTARSDAPAASAPSLRPAHFQHEIVLVAAAHLADRERPLGAAVEPHQHRRQILDADVHHVDVAAAGRSGTPRASRAASCAAG